MSESAVQRARAAAERAARIAAEDGAPRHEPYREPGWSEIEEDPSVWRLGLPSRLRWARPEDFTGQVRDDLLEWSANPAGRNLILVGPIGVGKSHAAVAACAEGAAKGIETRFLPTVELFELLRPGGPDGALWDLMAVERLILDDVGADRSTDWSLDRLYALVNRRWLEERPTIVTTNLDPRGPLEQAVRADTYSRLVGSGAVVLSLTGEDRRKVTP